MGLILPGLSQSSPPDVMRGEETEIIGHLAGGGGDGLFLRVGAAAGGGGGFGQEAAILDDDAAHRRVGPGLAHAGGRQVDGAGHEGAVVVGPAHCRGGRASARL